MNAFITLLKCSGQTGLPSLLGIGVTLLLSGCVSLDSLNPFSSSAPKVKVNELPVLEVKTELRSLWQASIGNAGSYSLAPAVVAGSVYAAAADGSLARFDEGKQVWRVATGRPISGGVGTDGNLVVVGTAKGEVLAFDAASGRESWKASVSSEVLAPPSLADGLVIIRSGDSRVVGLEASDGKRRWMYQRNVPALLLRSYASVLNAGKLTYVGFPGGRLVALDNGNGAAVWEATVATPKGTTELERITDVISSPVTNGNAVCAVAYQGRVACFDASSGSNMWSRDMSSIAGLDVDSGQLYVTDAKGVVYALDKYSGASVWMLDKLVTRSPTRPLALGEIVVVADNQGLVHALRSDNGSFVGRIKTDGSAIRTDPVRSATGFVVQTVNGSVYSVAAH
ncbi:MAG: outer membrane protein assembly factor BamB [Rugosibacter sp.]|nr:outer membrane protein assembly factor BamB [Rugosibacter sp.]